MFHHVLLSRSLPRRLFQTNIGVITGDIQAAQGHLDRAEQGGQRTCCRSGSGSLRRQSSFICEKTGYFYSF